MPQKLAKGTKALVVEGPSKGREGKVTKVAREYDREDQITRWMVWLDCTRFKVKTRLAFVRQIEQGGYENGKNAG